MLAKVANMANLVCGSAGIGEPMGWSKDTGGIGVGDPVGWDRGNGRAAGHRGGHDGWRPSRAGGQDDVSRRGAGLAATKHSDTSLDWVAACLALLSASSRWQRG
jgi:hypothetical protein